MNKCRERHWREQSLTEEKLFYKWGGILDFHLITGPVGQTLWWVKKQTCIHLLVKKAISRNPGILCTGSLWEGKTKKIFMWLEISLILICKWILKRKFKSSSPKQNLLDQANLKNKIKMNDLFSKSPVITNNTNIAEVHFNDYMDRFWIHTLIMLSMKHRTWNIWLHSLSFWN